MSEERGPDDFPPGGQGVSPGKVGATERGPDGLPEELDVTVVRPYKVPDIARRKNGAYTVFGVAATCLAGGLYAGNTGLMGGAAALALAGGYWMACAWPLRVDETAALATAASTVGFPVGHASAQLAWRGLRSRPTWRILLYSADEPPTRRGLVELDAVDGTVIGDYTEDNPEDWTAYAELYGATPAGDPKNA